MIAHRPPVQAVFNASGTRAAFGPLVRAGIVIALSVAIALAALAGLTSRVRGDDRFPALAERTPWTMTPAFARHLAATANTSCLPAAIKAALARANAACGIKVISTFRPGARIAGTGRISKHASCQAADFTSADYPCVYRALAGWSGKLSTDARRMRHVHIDDGRYARFVHGQARRYAKRWKHRHRLARRNGRRG